MRGSQPTTLWVLRTLVVLGALTAGAAAARIPIQASEGSQQARPDGYAASDGSWSGTFVAIDEEIPNDVDFLASPSGPSVANFYEVTLTEVLPPTDLSGIVLRYRYAKSGDNGGRTTNLTVELRQGGAIIASQSHTSIPGVSGSGWQQGTLTLTPAQAEAITDYADLRLRFDPSTTGGGNPRKAQVSWAELELPSAAAPVAFTERVSVSSAGAEGNAASQWPALSADGRYATFTSSAANLVAGDSNAKADVFVHDRVTGTTTRVSLASDGSEGNGSSQVSAISADGRYVAFQSLATNLVAGDTNGGWDVFVHDRTTGTTTRVSVASDGTGGNNWATLASISADGQYVAFASSASNLIPDDTNGTWDVFVHDRTTSTTSRVSVASDGSQGNQQSDAPAISADGGTVTFQSLASNLVPGDTNGDQDVFVHDRATGTTSRVSLASDGTQTNWISSAQAVSADGRYVAFRSIASNLVSGDTNQELDAFVHDRIAETTTRVSVASDGSQANDYSGSVVDISDNGRFIVFSSLATNLVPGDTNGVYDVFLHDLDTGTTTRVGVATYGTQGNAESHEVTISGDGLYVAFHSWATNLVAGDTNGTLDVFVRGPEMTTGAPPDVALTSPAAGATLFASEALSATATHASGITEVEFLVDDTVVGTVTTEPFAFTWDTASVADGTHTIEARATAVSGETASSSPVSVEVDNGLTPAERLETDLNSGQLTLDEYATNGTYLLIAPQLMDDRYQAAGAEIGGVVELAYYLRDWDDLSPETRQTISDALAQSRRGPLYGSVPVDSGGSSEASSAQVAGQDQCEEVYSLWGLLGTGWECQHQTVHFGITYITRGTGDYADDSVSPIDEIPAYIVQLAEGLEDAYDVYVNELNYPTRAAAVIPVSVWNVGVPRVLPVPGPEPLIETIDIPVEHGDPHYLTHHELFHVFQYENYIRDDALIGNWLPDVGVPFNWDIGPVGPLWWMEATAEWAAGYTVRSGVQAQPQTYAANLPHFLGRPDERISRFDPLINLDPNDCRCRQYGAFVLPEYLAGRLGTPGVGLGYNADVIRETFEALAGMPAPQFVEPAIEAVAVGYGTSFAGILPDFARANYLLEYDDGVGGGASDVQTIWRDRLQEDDRTKGDLDGLAPSRPMRARHDMTDGSAAQGSTTLKPGGSAYVDLVPSPRGSTGEMAITIANASAETEAHVMTLSYPAPPASPTICIETPVFIDPDGSGIVSVPINNGCEYAVLTVTHTAYNTADDTLDWSAEFTMTACLDSFEREVTEGWGVGPLGAWAIQPANGMSVDGSVALIDHQFGLANLPHAATQAGQPIELLMKWRVVPDGSESWRIDMNVSDSDPYGTYAGLSFQHSVTWGTLVGASDQRDDNPLGSGTNWWEYDSTGLPSPAGAVWMWSRVLIDDYGAYVRFWADGSAEPVTSAPVTSHWGLGGRGERWHAFEETQVPKVYPASWDRIWIDAGGSTSRFELDSLEIVQGCEAP